MIFGVRIVCLLITECICLLCQTSLGIFCNHCRFLFALLELKWTVQQYPWVELKGTRPQLRKGCRLGVDKYLIMYLNCFLGQDFSTYLPNIIICAILQNLKDMLSSFPDHVGLGIVYCDASI